jgi:hypothetical protein
MWINTIKVKQYRLQHTKQVNNCRGHDIILSFVSLWHVGIGSKLRKKYWEHLCFLLGASASVWLMALWMRALKGSNKYQLL